VELETYSAGNGAFFKAADHKGALAILARPTGFRPDVPTPKFGPKDEITADLTIFKTEADFDYANGSAEVLEGAKLQQTALVKNLHKYVGKAVVVVLNQIPTDKGNPAWVFDPADGETVAKVKGWIAAREAELADCPI
jgi:hypothetical protein